MKHSSKSLVFAFAAFGLCAVVYSVWYLYRQAVVKKQSHAAFTARASSEKPDIIRTTPGAPPIQPN